MNIFTKIKKFFSGSNPDFDELFSRLDRASDELFRQRDEAAKKLQDLQDTQGSDIDSYVHQFIRSDECKRIMDALDESTPIEYPVTLTYAVERLLITHVKLFILEDKVRDKDLSDEEIGQLKRKIDYWNGVVRPRLVAATGDMLSLAALSQDPEIIKEPNLKDYKAR